MPQSWCVTAEPCRPQSQGFFTAVSKGTSGFGLHSRKGVNRQHTCVTASCNCTQGLDEPAASSLHRATLGVPFLLTDRTQAQIKYCVLGDSTPATIGRLLNSVAHRASGQSSALRNTEPKAEGQACPGGAGGQPCTHAS